MRIPRRCSRRSAAGGGIAKTKVGSRGQTEYGVDSEHCDATAADHRVGLGRRPDGGARGLPFLRGVYDRAGDGEERRARADGDDHGAAYSDWQPEISAVGSLRAVHGVDVTTEVAGLVRDLKFRSGDEAKGGQVLVELNADSDIAQLHSFEAAAELSETAYARDKVQYEAQAISKAQLDSDAADLKSRRAQAAAQAALVAKKTLRAPFAGRLGITTVNSGQYLNPATSRHPAVGRSDLCRFQTAAATARQHCRWSDGPRDDRCLPGTRLRRQDQRHRSARRPGNSEFPNRGFGRQRRAAPPARNVRAVAVIAGSVQRYLTLPQTSITYNPYGATVFLAQKALDGSLIAQQTFVTTGSTRGDQVAVLSGIKEGDIVVTSGQLKLKNGTPIQPDNRVQPKNDPNPTPQEQ